MNAGVMGEICHHISELLSEQKKNGHSDAIIIVLTFRRADGK